MVVGVCRIVCHIPGNRSLKGKRQVVRKICERSRSRFHLSIAEVGELDHYQRAQIGFAVVGNDSRFVNSYLDQVLHFIEQLLLAPLLDQQIEILHYGESFHAEEESSLEDWPWLPTSDQDEDTPPPTPPKNDPEEKS